MITPMGRQALEAARALAGLCQLGLNQLLEGLEGMGAPDELPVDAEWRSMTATQGASSWYAFDDYSHGPPGPRGGAGPSGSLPARPQSAPGRSRRDGHPG